MQPPAYARVLGLAGMLPQLVALWLLLTGSEAWYFAALSIAYAYAALILSFLGGAWWGLAAQARPAPAWVWFAAVAPSLIALASAVPWATGMPWPGPSLVMLGGALVGALAVDWQLHRSRLAPDWWMALRLPLSLGLGAATLAAGLLA